MRQDKSKLLQFFRQPSVRTHCMEQLGIRKHEYSRKYLDFIDRLASSQSPIEKSASISTRTDGNGRSTWDSHQNFSEGRIISMFQQYLENQSQASLSASSLQGGPKTHKKVRELADLRNPVNWYQFARGNRRKIFLHVGPTNSGKTYQALEKFRTASSGIYCGPLRLLAHEIYERMNTEYNLPCQLVTGEERRPAYDLQGGGSDEVDSDRGLKPGARHTAATVEMADFGRFHDIAVIDEIQMLGDRDRGWAFTHALLFLPCNELHLCGDPSTVPVIQRLARSLGEQVIVNRYERLRPLRVSDNPLSSLSEIQPGDCVVTFSRKSVFRLKENIERSTGLRCAVVYGSLPPETRSEQARLFNQPDSGFDVMVASDAVGMGLNLNINRMVFDSIEKFDGKRMVQLSAGQIKQIAGRAGRFNAKQAAVGGDAQDLGGTVTAMRYTDLAVIRRCVNMPADQLERLTRVGLQPTTDIINEFASYHPKLPLSKLLDRFEDMARVDGDYFLCQLDDAKMVADQLQFLDMPLEERFQFTMAPIRLQDQLEIDCLQALASARSKHHQLQNRLVSRRGFSVLDIPLMRRSVAGSHLPKEIGDEFRRHLSSPELHGLMALEDEMEPIRGLLRKVWQPARSHYGLTQYERLHRVVTLYNWLHYRFPETYQSTAMASVIKRFLEELIDESLFQMHSVSRFSNNISNGDTAKSQLLFSALFDDTTESK